MIHYGIIFLLNIENPHVNIVLYRNIPCLSLYLQYLNGDGLA